MSDPRSAAEMLDALRDESDARHAKATYIVSTNDRAKMIVEFGCDAFGRSAPHLGQTLSHPAFQHVILVDVEPLPEEITAKLAKVELVQLPADRTVEGIIGYRGLALAIEEKTEARTRWLEFMRHAVRNSTIENDVHADERDDRFAYPSIESVIERYRQRGPQIHEAIGIAGIDERTGGGPVYGTRFYVLGAPDAGKTLLLAQMADTYLQNGVAVGFLASDEDSEDVLQRFLQRRGVTRGECERQAGSAHENALSDVSQLPLRIYPRSYTIEQAASDLAAFAASRGMRAALFMDSLQTILCAAEDIEASTYANVTKRVEAIRTVATQHQLIAICTSEMSRGSYRSIRGSEQSDLAAGKESGAIEYSARVMVALRPVPKESDMVELRFAKNKHGRVHREGDRGVFLKLHTATQHLEEMRDYEPSANSGSGSKRRLEKLLDDVALAATWMVENPGKGKRQVQGGMKVIAGMGKERVDAAVTYLDEIDAVETVAVENNKQLHYINGEKLGSDILDRIPIGKRSAVQASKPPVSGCTGDTQRDTQESGLSGGVPGHPIGGRTPTTIAPAEQSTDSEPGTPVHMDGGSSQAANR